MDKSIRKGQVKGTQSEINDLKSSNVGAKK